MNIIYVIIERIRTDSPRFFVILRWVTGIMAVAGWVATWLISKGVWSPDYEAAIKEAAGYLGVAATAMWGTSFLPVKDKVVVMDGPGGTDPGPGKTQPPKP